jgi:hypothetical protein
VYDVIGDIHGHSEALETLLGTLGYTVSRGAWRYPGSTRKAVFIGDYIDRGPDSPSVIEIVRAMVEADSAIALMGNHEYNAILWHTRDHSGEPLRSHTAVHRRQHQATLDAFSREWPSARGGRESPGRPAQSLPAALDWMRGLPLYYEDASIRAVHAAWDASAIATLRESPSALRDDRFLHLSTVVGTAEHRAVETLLKGIEIPIPEGRGFADKEGTRRTRTRIRWWESPGDDPVPLGQIALPPADTELADLSVPADSLPTVGYYDERPVFLGHYWLTGTPRPMTDRVACVDYSVARGGRLCAYRYDGDIPLREDCFVCVP